MYLHNDFHLIHQGSPAVHRTRHWHHYCGLDNSQHHTWTGSWCKHHLLEHLDNELWMRVSLSDNCIANSHGELLSSYTCHIWFSASIQYYKCLYPRYHLPAVRIVHKVRKASENRFMIARRVCHYWYSLVYPSCYITCGDIRYNFHRYLGQNAQWHERLKG